MAKEPGRNNSTDELKVKIARSRDRVARDFRGVRHELDIPRKIRRSFREQTLLWVGAAVVVGTLVVTVRGTVTGTHTVDVTGTCLLTSAYSVTVCFWLVVVGTWV